MSDDAQDIDDDEVVSQSEEEVEDDEDVEDEEEEEEEDPANDYDYDELDDIDLFKRWDRNIWEDFQIARKEFFTPQDDEENEEEEEEEEEEEGEEFDDGFDRDGFVSEYLSSHPGLDENRVKMVLTLGIYGGERNEFHQRHGKGHAIYANEDTYIGHYENELKHGYGVYVYKSALRKKREKGLHPQDVKALSLAKDNETVAVYLAGDEYIQAAQEVCSQAKELHPLRVRYVLQYGAYPFYAGQYKDDKKHGAGVMKNKDGSIYVGSWALNKRHGNGEMYYPNGDRYVGQWSDGLKHGSGTYQFAGKDSEFEGTWERGNLVHGHWKMSDGIFYDGKFEDNVPEGSGEMWFIDETQKNLEARISGRMRAGEWIPSFDFVFDHSSTLSSINQAANK